MKCTKSRQGSTDEHFSILLIKCPLKLSYIIRTNSTIVTNHLITKYGVYIKSVACIPKSNYIAINIFSYDGKLYYIQTADGICKTERPLKTLDNIMEYINKFSDSCIVFHGAGLTYKDKAHIFLGASSSGKSTLASYLSSFGMGYLSDDCIPITKSSLLVTPYCLPITLRKHGLNILINSGIYIDNIKELAVEDETRYIHTPRTNIRKPVPIAQIIFIEISDHNEVTKLNKSDIVSRLLCSTSLIYNIDYDYIRTIIKLSCIPCFFIKYKDMSYVKDIIIKYT